MVIKGREEGQRYGERTWRHILCLKGGLEFTTARWKRSADGAQRWRVRSETFWLAEAEILKKLHEKLVGSAESAAENEGTKENSRLFRKAQSR